MRTTFSSTYCPTVPCVQADGGANLYVSGLAEEVTEEELLECFKVARRATRPALS